MSRSTVLKQRNSNFAIPEQTHYPRDKQCSELNKTTPKYGGKPEENRSEMKQLVSMALYGASSQHAVCVGFLATM